MPSNSEILGLTGLWDPTKRLDSLTSSLVSGTATRQPFIGGANGENVAADYQAGGRFSSQRFFTGGGDMRTVIPPPALPVQSSPALQGAWANRVSTPPAAGMPDYLAAAARRNLAQEDKTINRFNYTARFAATPSTVTPFGNGKAVKTVTQAASQMSLADRIRSYRPNYGSYDQVKSQISWGGAHPGWKEDEE